MYSVLLPRCGVRCLFQQRTPGWGGRLWRQWRRGLRRDAGLGVTLFLKGWAWLGLCLSAQRERFIGSCSSSTPVSESGSRACFCCMHSWGCMHTRLEVLLQLRDSPQGLRSLEQMQSRILPVLFIPVFIWPCQWLLLLLGIHHFIEGLNQTVKTENLVRTALFLLAH